MSKAQESVGFNPMGFSSPDGGEALRMQAWTKKLLGEATESSLVKCSREEDPFWGKIPLQEGTEEDHWRRDVWRRRAAAFLGEYETLCRKYGLSVSGGSVSYEDEYESAIVPSTDDEIAKDIQILRDNS